MRKFIKSLHTWLSIPAGVIITVVCLTGAPLVFQDEILRLANPSHYYVKDVKEQTIPLGELIPMVNAQLDSNSVASVQIFHNPERTYTMTLKEGFRISAFVDPYTGEVTGRYNFRENPFYTIMVLHRWLMDGTRTWGKYSVGISTLLFVIILITGFIIWMPKRLNLSHLKIRFKKGNKRLLFDLHNVLGVYACLVLIVCSLTGLMWSFEWYRNGVFKIFGAEILQESRHGGSHGGGEKAKTELDVAPWQTVFNTLVTSNPDYEHIRVQDGNAAVHLNSFLTSRATDKYKFDKYSGAITNIELFKDQETTTKVWAWAYSLHVGNYWGIWSKIFTCVFSLVGASLPVTGYYMFFVKRKREKALPKPSNYDKGLLAYNEGDYKRAIYYWELSSFTDHNANAQYKLANIYHVGEGVAKNPERALRLFKIAAEQGHVDAMTDFAGIYEYGVGVAPNDEEAFRWYKIAAEKGSAEAQHNLALMYKYGEGVETNILESLKWYKTAAEKGYLPAINDLALIYEKGEGVEKNLEEAVRWSEMAAEQGDAYSLCRLAYIYAKGQGVEKNEAEANKCYAIIAEKGFANDINNVAFCYENGGKIEKDEAEAARLYKIAAEKGNINAQCRLAYIYVKGQGVAINPEEAFRLFMIAAGQGNRVAQYNLASMYEKGKGVEKNIEEAKKWYTAAAEQGDSDAVEALKRLA